MGKESLRCSLLPPIYAIELAREEIADGIRNFMSMRFQGEVAGIEETHLGAWVVAFERFGPRSQEERIAVAPDRQRCWLLAAKVFLEFGIEGDIAQVVQKQVELNILIPGTS